MKSISTPNLIRSVFFVFFLCIIVFYLGRTLNPFDARMFEFHDETQAARVQEFVLNLRNLKIPPRLAPHFSYNLGYPLFNFYAPAPYWIASIIALIFPLGIIFSIKLTFLLLLVVSFVGVFLFLRNYFDFYPSLLGATTYATTLYMPLNIFVRGNIGEAAFLAFFPLALHMLYKNSHASTQKNFIVTTFILFILLTSHNILSLFSVPLLVVYCLLQENKKVNFLSLVLAAFMSSYFFIPLVLENSLTYAKEVALLTSYKDHFLCINQLWQSQWGYGGSAAGCLADGMSFQLGKPQVILLLLGIAAFLVSMFKKTTFADKRISIFFGVTTIGSLFLTSRHAAFVWDILNSVMAIFQFPWRFVAFSMIGIAYFAAYFVNSFNRNLRVLISLAVSIGVLMYAGKYFTRTLISSAEYEKKYLSEGYITQEAAQRVPEYVPKTVDYSYWKSLKTENMPIQSTEQTDFEKKVSTDVPRTVAVNVHYFPFWKLYVDGKQFIPHEFDKLGRPQIDLSSSSQITVRYEQTKAERIANVMTIMATILVISAVHPYIWKRILNYTA